MTSAIEQVREHRLGSVLQIELNRPEAINALNMPMILAIDAALDRAETDQSIQAVLFSGAGARGFCAGGDVRQLYVDVHAGNAEAPSEYFAREYALNARIAEFGTPTIAWMHGACMGGGVGIAGHCRFRIVTDSSSIAMPETKIGFTPDVGGSWLLGRAPGRLGERLALHGQVMRAAEALAAGFADHYVPERSRDAVFEALGLGELNAESIASLIRRFASTPPSADFGLDRELIDQVYALPTVAEIVTALRRIDAPAAAELDALSPTALEVTLRSVRSARTLSLRSALAQELRLAEWFFRERGDALEGIRALLVDKDRSPQWPAVATAFPI